MSFTKPAENGCEIIIMVREKKIGKFFRRGNERNCRNIMEGYLVFVISSTMTLKRWNTVHSWSKEANKIFVFITTKSTIWTVRKKKGRRRRRERAKKWNGKSSSSRCRRMSAITGPNKPGNAKTNLLWSQGTPTRRQILTFLDSQRELHFGYESPHMRSINYVK